MKIKKIGRGLVVLALVLFSFQTFAADSDIDQFLKKYRISQSQFDQFEKKYLDSDLGLKKLTGLRDQLSPYTKKKFKSEDLIRFAAAFSRKLNADAVKNMNEVGGNFGLTQKDYDRALDEGLDKTDGENPREFVKKIADTRVILAKNSKLSQDKALLLARSVQIRMDMVIMKSHLEDEEYMRTLLGEKALTEIPLEKPGKPGGVI